MRCETAYRSGRSLKYPGDALDAWPDIESGELVVIPKWTWTMNILSIERVDANTNEVFTRLRCRKNVLR